MFMSSGITINVTTQNRARIITKQIIMVTAISRPRIGLLWYSVSISKFMPQAYPELIIFWNVDYRTLGLDNIHIYKGNIRRKVLCEFWFHRIYHSICDSHKCIQAPPPKILLSNISSVRKSLLHLIALYMMGLLAYTLCTYFTLCSAVFFIKTLWLI